MSRKAPTRTKEFLKRGAISQREASAMYSEWVSMSSHPYLRVLLLGLIPTTNATQILQAHKQMEYDNNEH